MRGLLENSLHVTVSWEEIGLYVYRVTSCYVGPWCHRLNYRYKRMLGRKCFAFPRKTKQNKRKQNISSLSSELNYDKTLRKLWCSQLMVRSMAPGLLQYTQSIRIIAKMIPVVQLSVLIWATQAMPRDSSGTARGWYSLPIPCLDTTLPGPSHLLLWGKLERHSGDIVKPKQF